MINNKYTRKRWYGTIIIIIGLATIPYLLTQDPEQYTPLLKIDHTQLIGLFFITIASYFVTSFATWHLLHVAGAKVTWITNLALTFMANFLNYFGPAQPGLSAKAIYLKMTRQVRYSDFAVATGINAILMILIAGLFGSAISTWKWVVNGEPFQDIIVLSLGLFIAPLLFPLLWRFLPKFKKSHRPTLKFIGETLENFENLWKFRRVILPAALIVIIQYSISGFAVWLSYHVIGVNLAYSLSLLIAALVSVSNIVPITPNNVGISELAIGVVSEISGTSFANGVLVGTILRVMHLFMAILFMPIASWWLASRTTTED